MQFIATPSLLNKIVNCTWEMDHIDAITTGLQPYIFGDVTPEDSQQMGSIYQLVMTGTAAPSVDDAALLMAPAKPTLPKVLYQTPEMLLRMLILFNVLLPPPHDMGLNLAQFLRDFSDREGQLHQDIPTTPGYSMYIPLLIIQWVTLRINA